jgi:transcriptional regulator with XRE-family HTH domain
MINGETLRRLRLLKGLNQKEAAKKLGVSATTYGKLEKSVWLQGEQLQTILKALDCTNADVAKALEILN